MNQDARDQLNKALQNWSCRDAADIARERADLVAEASKAAEQAISDAKLHGIGWMALSGVAEPSPPVELVSEGERQAIRERDEARVERDCYRTLMDAERMLNAKLTQRLAALTGSAPARDAKVDAIANAIRPRPQGFRGVGM